MNKILQLRDFFTTWHQGIMYHCFCIWRLEFIHPDTYTFICEYFHSRETETVCVLPERRVCDNKVMGFVLHVGCSEYSYIPALYLLCLSRESLDILKKKNFIIYLNNCVYIDDSVYQFITYIYNTRPQLYEA
jgi:hypothetical protein